MSGKIVTFLLQYIGLVWYRIVFRLAGIPTAVYSAMFPTAGVAARERLSEESLRLLIVASAGLPPTRP